MYLTVKQTAEYLELPEEYIARLVRENQIRFLHDGEQYLINREQFQSHLEQMEKYRAMIQAYLDEPIPEDPDVKDED
ncbi:excisionase family DNA-binding protein [Halobacillus locisalis]|uniref:Excisionase family DNA-binding protein n=1 Tax=Halobacillus locisalis TaxID=220753 RepID=A0A838CWR2_9BACI|nr:excisionase family DNA-binding protein [Halobacillus locisalis]MBA2176351.1 excisionase family DNA-binding protein [Halobacillus locisalis]